ncbi:TenA family transcriptional regulator [candidate division KSB1 bacterium]|nr:TenA family transcriptional regulator [candidate division KSB1 bacterium]NIR72395.1 TenA family transcriptional regulator [candidate division KSB1 bacterium]NIS25060.1 TenA family transcriptional regulator [candidate division KSB1 bacterium]NIT71979.1 TenA family transcriptional regulator [candidate division KSB1 bacterium]NIU25737.1 TenA family transcriptional regulator [candidate division KSB1 bacterium]
MPLTCKSLIDKHKQAWEAATVHPFLNDCKMGTIKPEQFNIWLVQDYLFVTEFTRMVARLLAVAPVPHFDTVLGGLAALKDELNWFAEKAQERNLDLNTSRQDTCKRYCQFMENLGLEPYTVQAVAFWAIELAYNQAWQLPGPMVNAYEEFVDRWGNPEFTNYVRRLEKQADEMLAKAREEDCNRTEEVFTELCGLEKAFWQMAHEGKAS